MSGNPKTTLLVLDPDPRSFDGFYGAVAKLGEVRFFSDLEQLLLDIDYLNPPVILLDVMALKESPSAPVAELVELRGRLPIGIVSAVSSDEYLFDIRRWGLLNIAVKLDPVTENEVRVFVECLRDPLNGFGLYRHLSSTVEMYNMSVCTIPEKNEGIERVINHFATAGFEVHDLYDVRLILEEALNNSFFHAFKLPNGEEKYNLHTFSRLAEGEKVRIEYGSNAMMAGFTVTDNAGTLALRTIINKLERQLNREGLFDVSGRGLYLSRMLSTSLVINIEEHKRTQLIALFDQRRRTNRPKPLLVNYVGTDTFPEWRLDPDFD